MTLLESRLSEMPVFLLGVGASLAASLGTAVGTLPVIAIKRVSQRAQDVLQSAAAGIMLSATVSSLVLPGIEAATRRYGSPFVASLVVCASMLVGALAILLLHQRAPHEHFFSGREGRTSRELRRIWLFVLAITLHNVPEGMAVGVSFGDGNVTNGIAVTIAIFLQNLPEGFVVALGLVAAGYRRPFSILVAAATGMVESAGGLIGAAAVALVAAALPWAMGFAAGAMLFVISHEIIPETHRNGYEKEATFGLIVGFSAMVVLGAALG